MGLGLTLNGFVAQAEPSSAAQANQICRVFPEAMPLPIRPTGGVDFAALESRFSLPVLFKSTSLMLSQVWFECQLAILYPYVVS